jgi:hypothetical protein
MPLLEGHAQLCLIGEKGGAPFGRARTFWKGAHLLEGRAPFGRARTFWKGMPLLEGHAQLCLFDRKGRAPVGQCAPKGDWHSWELLNLVIQHCPDGVVQVVSTRGVAVSITDCRLKTRLPRIFFYRQPSRQASTPCPHPHAETAELSDAVFSTAKKIQELK